MARSTGVATSPGTGISCAGCEACCCRLEVMLVSETGVPENFVQKDRWGGRIMARLDDGRCSALDRDSMRCMIYAQRPWICREFEMGGDECLSTRAASL